MFMPLTILDCQAADGRIATPVSIRPGDLRPFVLLALTCGGAFSKITAARERSFDPTETALGAA